MKQITLYIPRWLYPNNLGDSIASTMIPKVLKAEHPSSEIVVVTYGDLLDVFNYDTNVLGIREPNREEVAQPPQVWLQAAMSGQNPINGDTYVIYPEQHPNVYQYWKAHDTELFQHPTANIVTVNLLLQLGLEKYLHNGFDLFPEVWTPARLRQEPARLRQEPARTLAIVPATKKAGRSTPHPYCDGEGYRFNGPRGLESWTEFVRKIKELNPDLHVLEISPENLGLGDEHFKFNSFQELAEKIDEVDLGVMCDGGVHNAFMARRTPVVLFHASLVCKPEYYAHSLAYVPSDLLVKCRLQCHYYYVETYGGEDKSQTCNLECEHLDPSKLAEYTSRVLDGKERTYAHG